MNGETTAHIWDGQNMVAEKTNGTTTNYIRSNRLLASEKAGVKSYYLYNVHGDVSMLTDGTKNILQSYQYDAFGNQKNPSDTDLNPFRYCGEYYDVETGDIYLRARYYDSGVGRFNSEDTNWDSNNMIYGDDNASERKDPDLNAIMQSSNLYCYCINNPANLVDPAGMVAYERFSSPEEAAKDWAWNYYGSSYYVGFECTSIIYEAVDENGETYYSYTYGVWGTPHETDSLAPLSYMPDDAVAVASIHSHPNSHFISEYDKDFGDAYGLDVYVVMPGLEGKADIWKSVKTRDGRRTLAVATGTGVAPLSEERKKELVGKFQSKWYAHVEYGCPKKLGCENQEWPRTL